MRGETAERILDAAEKRVRRAGYNGFSFRDIAKDVGVKSASVHHHFPTKGALVARLAERYTERFMTALEAAARTEGSVPAMRRLFRKSLEDDNRMCLCGMMAAESDTLPPTAAAAARRFFERLLDALGGGPSSQDAATRQRAFHIVATLEGALLLARVLGDPGAFDRATEALSV
ncbi:MAG: TetR/AcrR family transcriptional regulator [Pseudomonadota bacterium]